mgnify:CR=1 FL=1
MSQQDGEQNEVEVEVVQVETLIVGEGRVMGPKMELSLTDLENLV